MFQLITVLLAIRILPISCAFGVAATPKQLLTLQLSSSSSEQESRRASLEEKLLSASLSSEHLGHIHDAAATVTQESCKLLGTTSIGVDYGLARTGVAVTRGFQQQPLQIISNENSTEVCWSVIQHVISEQAQQIVVGLPLHKNGTEALQSNVTRAFATQLACWTLARLGPSVKVYMWDERYTSKEAAARVRSQDPTHRSLYKQLDADAACIILEDFYEENGKGAEKVLIPEDVQDVCRQAWEAQLAERQKLSSLSRDEKGDFNSRRKEAMERARKMEESMAADGTLGTSRKKKKRKKSRPSRGKWTTL